MKITPQMVQMGVQVGSALFAKGQAEESATNASNLEGALDTLVANRQSIIDPSSGVSAFTPTDYSDSFSNPYANLRVATKSAEIQMEQTDIALANTLDTLMMTGMGAGGATALAQAAKQGKAEVAASIEQQEVQNEKLRAQGEESLQARIMQEKSRVESINLSENTRVQGAQMAGKQFMWEAQEERELVELDRAQAKIDEANAQTASDEASMWGALGDLTGSLGSLNDDWSSSSTGSSSSGVTNNYYNTNPS